MAPEANGRPHWSTVEGGHLYYSVNGSWIVNTEECSPDTTSCDAYFRTAGGVPVGEAVWRCHNKHERWCECRFCTRHVGGHTSQRIEYYDHTKTVCWEEQRLTVAELSPAMQIAQMRYCPGFRVGGLPDGKHPTLSGAFMRTLEGGRLANGRPHWSTAEGGHLYYSINGNWCLNADGLTPDKDGATAWISRAGAVPVGEVVWQYYNGCKIVEQRLAVAKLLPAEAARLRIVGDDASEIRWWEIDGGDVDHLIVEAGCTSTATIGGAGRRACSPAALELLGLLRSRGMDEVAAPRAEAILAKMEGDTQAALDHICKHPATSASHTGHINNGGVTWDEPLGKFRAARHCDQLSDSLVRRAVYGPWPSCTTISLLKI